MHRSATRIGTELIPVVLVVASLAGTWFLIISMYRRQVGPKNTKPPAVAAAAPTPAAAASEPEPDPSPPPPPAKPKADPTRQALARLAALEAEQRRAAQDADRRADSLGQARNAAQRRTDAWRRRELLARAQVDALEKTARRLEDETDALGAQRDVLAQQGDSLKSALARARSRSGAAVLPYKGPNGTWRLPIAIECRNGNIIMQPGGPTISLLELSPVLGLRGSPLVVAVAHKLAQLQATPTPDGEPAVPYILFVIRPDGVRPYYEARARLEMLGISFGYELVEQDADVEYPDLTDPAEWSDAPPVRLLAQDREPKSADRANSGSRSGQASEFVWRSVPAASGDGDGSGQGGSGAPLNLREPVGGESASLPPLAPSGIDDRPMGGSGSRGQTSVGMGSSGGGVAGLGSDGSAGAPLEPAPLPLRVPSPRDPTSGGLAGSPSGLGDGSIADGPDTRPSGGSSADGTGARPGAGSMTDGTGTGPTGGSASGSRGGSGREWANNGSAEKAIRALAQLESRQAFAAGAGASAANPEDSLGDWPSGSRTNQTDRGAAVTMSPAGDLPPLSRQPSSGSSADRQFSGGQPRANQLSGTPSDTQPAANFDPASLPPGSISDARSSGAQYSRGQPSGGQFGSTSRSGSGSGSGNNPSSTAANGTAGADGVVVGSSDGSGTQPKAGTVGMGLGGSDSGDPSGKKGGSGFDPSVDYRKERKLEVVVACGPNGVVVQPGGFHLSLERLASSDQHLLKTMRAVVASRQAAEPKIDYRPRVKFVVEPGGEQTYLTARKQTVMVGLGWPVSLQLTEGDGVRIHTAEERRQ
jgi:hypothetical protein